MVELAQVNLNTRSIHVACMWTWLQCVADSLAGHRSLSQVRLGPPDNQVAAGNVRDAVSLCVAASG